MKIVLDATTLDGLPSGAATRMAALGAELQGRPDLELLHLVRPGCDPLPGLHCIPFAGMDSPWGRWRTGRRLDALLAAEGAHIFQAAALPLPALSACPTLLTVHDLRFLHDGASQGLLRRLWGAACLPANLRRAAGVVAVSESTATELQTRALGLQRAPTVVPNAPTPGLRRVQDVQALAALRRRADINCRFLLMVGPLAAHKRMGQALDLLAAVRQHEHGADLALLLLGRADPEATLTLARRAERMGLAHAVRVLGSVDDETLAAALSGAEALLLLGRSEGFSIPLVDAQALALPVVAVQAGALPEVAGDGAWLAPPDDLLGLASAVLHAVTPSDLREARLHRGLELAARWSWRRSADALHACWRDVLADTAAQPGDARC